MPHASVQCANEMDKKLTIHVYVARSRVDYSSITAVGVDDTAIYEVQKVTEFYAVIAMQILRITTVSEMVRQLKENPVLRSTISSSRF